MVVGNSVTPMGSNRTESERFPTRQSTDAQKGASCLLGLEMEVRMNMNIAMERIIAFIRHYGCFSNVWCYFIFHVSPEGRTPHSMVYIYL